VSAALDVTNSGDRAGAEVVQLYVRELSPSVPRPEKELAAFAKVWLEPGETRRVELELPPRGFAFWDVVDHDWRVNPGEFELLAGSSSRDIRARQRIVLQTKLGGSS
jgi:beta-glucosidase